MAAMWLPGPCAFRVGAARVSMLLRKGALVVVSVGARLEQQVASDQLEHQACARPHVRRRAVPRPQQHLRWVMKVFVERRLCN